MGGLNFILTLCMVLGGWRSIVPRSDIYGEPVQHSRGLFRGIQSNAQDTDEPGYIQVRFLKKIV